MSITETAAKYKFEGIGKASATATFLALAAKPELLVLTQGPVGKVIFFLLTWFYSALASMGLVMLNVGISNIQILAQKEGFDATWDEVFKVINEKGDTLTEAEKKALDDKVIAAHNKFGTFGKLLVDGGNS